MLHKPEQKETNNQRSAEQPLVIADVLTPTHTKAVSGKRAKRRSWHTELVAGKTRFFWYTFSMSLLSFLCSFPVTMLIGAIPGDERLSIAVSIGNILMFGGLVGMPLSFILASEITHREPLPEEEGIYVIGPLLERMVADERRRTELHCHLTVLLPLLKDSDADVLESRHYEIMNRSIYRHANGVDSADPVERAYLVAVLEAYSCVGDYRALAAVRRIAEEKTSVIDPTVVEAAQRCLPYLEKAAQTLRQSETLLRASAAPVQNDTLLRPASAGTQTQPEQLLRPADKDNNF